MLKLCLALGKTKRELLSQISSQELNEWIAYDRISPIGYERADIQAATVSSTIANTFRGKGSKPAKIIDFIPQYKKRKPKKSKWQDQLKLVEILNKGFGGEDKRNG